MNSKSVLFSINLHNSKWKSLFAASTQPSLSLKYWFLTKKCTILGHFSTICSTFSPCKSPIQKLARVIPLLPENGLMIGIVRSKYWGRSCYNFYFHSNLNTNFEIFKIWNFLTGRGHLGLTSKGFVFFYPMKLS